MWESQSWDTLVWSIVSPEAGPFRQEAINELVRRTGGDYEEALAVVRERLTHRVPLGVDDEWRPSSIHYRGPGDSGVADA